MAGKEKFGYRASSPKFFKPDSGLKNKVGNGAPDRAAVGEAQRYLDTLETDIAPQLGTYVLALQTAVDDARGASALLPEHLARLSRPLMDVKAMSGMFGEMMLCRVSAMLLAFLEDVRRLDAEVLQIVDTYLKVAKTLIHLKLRSETDPAGQVLLVEIRQACTRYYEKHAVG